MKKLIDFKNSEVKKLLTVKAAKAEKSLSRYISDLLEAHAYED